MYHSNCKLLCRGVKNFENTLVDLNVADAPKIGTRSVCGTWLALRSEIIQMLELKQKVVKRQGANTPASSADNRKKAAKQKVDSAAPFHCFQLLLPCSDDVFACSEISTLDVVCPCVS